jgi:tetratricopeptide (TPR) repeat protein
MKKNDYSEKIDSSSSPCLSLDELRAFSNRTISSLREPKIEQHLAHCSLCADAIEGISAVADKDQIRPIVRSLSDAVHHRIGQLTGTRRNWRLYYRVAAVLIIAVAALLYLVNQKPQHEILFAKYFTPYPNTIPITRGASGEIKLKRGLAEYEFENYEQAIIILEDVVTSEPENTTAKFYLGMSYLCRNQPDSAVAQFRSEIQHGKNPFVEPARWYLGLAALKKRDVNQASMIFGQLKAESQAYKQQANELLNLLEKMQQ